jgi:hypothetical protein
MTRLLAILNTAGARARNRWRARLLNRHLDRPDPECDSGGAHRRRPTPPLHQMECYPIDELPREATALTASARHRFTVGAHEHDSVEAQTQRSCPPSCQAGGEHAQRRRRRTGCNTPASRRDSIDGSRRRHRAGATWRNRSNSQRISTNSTARRRRAPLDHLDACHGRQE